MKESNYTEIVMSSEFETLAQPLMVEIVRRRQLPAVRPPADPQFDSTGKCTDGCRAGREAAWAPLDTRCISIYVLFILKSVCFQSLWPP